MIEKLDSRLAALDTAVAGIRQRLAADDVMDGLAVAKLLIAVDGAVNRLVKLAGDLRPALFKNGGDNDDAGDDNDDNDDNDADADGDAGGAAAVPQRRRR
jgi:hypothetical protein